MTPHVSAKDGRTTISEFIEIYSFVTLDVLLSHMSRIVCIKDMISFFCASSLIFCNTPSSNESNVCSSSVGPHFRWIERPLIKIIKFFIKLIWFSSNVVICLFRNVQMVSFMSCRSKNFLSFKGNRHEHNSARNTSNKNNRQDAGKVERNRLSKSSLKIDLLRLTAMDADWLASYLSTYQFCLALMIFRQTYAHIFLKVCVV
jgi:hypothetical protein